MTDKPLKAVSDMTLAERLQECEAAMARHRATFQQGDNRHGLYGRNLRDSYNRHAAAYERLTGKPAPSIYD